MDSSKSTTVRKLTRPSWQDSVSAFVYALERKDPYTRGHSQRVQALTERMTEALAENNPTLWDSYMCECASVASVMHDVGKLIVEKHTLRSTLTLTDEQKHELSDHPYEGAVIASQFFPQEVVLGILNHHERWDGKTDGAHYGYPFGLVGESISPIARVIKVCDAYDAMTTERPQNNHRALPPDVAVTRIQSGSGSQFDPEYVKVFVEKVFPRL